MSLDLGDTTLAVEDNHGYRMPVVAVSGVQIITRRSGCHAIWDRRSGQCLSTPSVDGYILSPASLAALEAVLKKHPNCLHPLSADAKSALDHGEFLARSGEFLLRVMNDLAVATEAVENGVSGAEHVLEGAREDSSDAWRALHSAIYEFRKRAARATGKPEVPMMSLGPTIFLDPTECTPKG